MMLAAAAAGRAHCPFGMVQVLLKFLAYDFQVHDIEDLYNFNN